VPAHRPTHGRHGGCGAVDGARGYEDVDVLAWVQGRAKSRRSIVPHQACGSKGRGCAHVGVQLRTRGCSSSSAPIMGHMASGNAAPAPHHRLEPSFLEQAIHRAAHRHLALQHGRVQVCLMRGAWCVCRSRQRSCGPPQRADGQWLGATTSKQR